MEIRKCKKESFTVIGKEGSSLDGADAIKKLWDDANSHFHEIAPYAKRDENGHVIGIWGAMSDMTHSFKPWEENFTKGLYLAGVEVADDAEPLEGWVKWVIPSYEYLCVKNETPDTFFDVLQYMKENQMELAGAVHDYLSPQENGQAYMFFPICKL